MPTSTISSIVYYPPIPSFWTGNDPWYIAFAAAAAVIAVIFIAARHGRMRSKLIAALGVILISIAIAAFLKAYPPPTWSTPAFSSQEMLQNLWTRYKANFIQTSTGRVIDDPQTGQTTSEAEGYAMLQAVWMDDKPTFDESWQWTQANLQRNDHLFSWLYGKQPNGTYGVLTAQDGQNSASDADTDIALALIFAYSRWQDPAYLRAAVPIVKNIWKEEVFTVNGTPYMGTNNFASQPAPGGEELVNSSYLSPYAYRIFGFIDPSDNWNALIGSSYQILDKGMEAPLGGAASSSIGLPPDWMMINTATGALSAPSPAAASATTPSGTAQTTDFGYDALRVPLRIALDWEWYRDPSAKSTLEMMGFLSAQWQQYHLLDAVYRHNGTPAAYYQTPAMYGGTIGYFLIADPADAQAVYASKLLSLYDPDTTTWKLPLDYYDANIAWFGIALYNNALPNLFALNLSTSSPSTATSSASPSISP